MSLVKTGLRFVLGRNLANLLTTGRGYSYGGGDPLNTSDGLQSQSKLGNIKGKLKELL